MDVFNFPISFSVSTVIETDVAEKTEPRKAAFNKFSAVKSCRKKKKYNPPHSNKGMDTPKQAMINDFKPVLFNSFISVSIPAVNINIITPISAVFTRKSELSKIPKPLGPSIMPATSAPTTCGI